MRAAFLSPRFLASFNHSLRPSINDTRTSHQHGNPSARSQQQMAGHGGSAYGAGEDCASGGSSAQCFRRMQPEPFPSPTGRPDSIPPSVFIT